MRRCKRSIIAFCPDGQFTRSDTDTEGIGLVHATQIVLVRGAGRDQVAVQATEIVVIIMAISKVIFVMRAVKDEHARLAFANRGPSPDSDVC